MNNLFTEQRVLACLLVQPPYAFAFVWGKKKTEYFTFHVDIFLFLVTSNQYKMIPFVVIAPCFYV